ncbi:BLUF domain-containing protein [Polaromonas aquatica]|uniref:BLUF domain-containing protein n=1 Tax=Polaromonas aquatica TaxID=332657 RepID=UPI003D64B6BE
MTNHLVGNAAPYVAAPGEMEVERVVTASMCNMKEGIFAQMEKIRADSLRNNTPHGIHVVLHYQSGWFVHWVEGPAAAVRDLMQRVQHDPRHHSPHTLHTSKGRRILPTPWSMAMSQATESAVGFGRRVIALREQLEKGKQYSPSSVLRRLSAPMRLAQAQGLADPEAFHRMGICSAAGNEAFDMVGWLAQKTGGTVAKRRFAGETDFDGSSEYIDFMEGGYPCRLIAVARNGLTHGLRRAFLPEWPHFVMLFCGTARFDDALMDRMVAACDGLPAKPALVGVARDADTHSRMQDMAQAARLEYVVGGVATPDNCSAIWQTMRDQLDRAGAPPSSVWDVPRMAA